MKRNLARSTGAALGVVLLASCGGGERVPSTYANCAAMVETFTRAGLRVVSAGELPAAAATTNQAALPPHCEIVGAIEERVGVDNQPYAIKFRLRIPKPSVWNGKFVFSGGGGTNGSVGDALTAQGSSSSPLALGFAVLSQDSGHDNAVNNLPAKSATRTFMFDPEARRNFGYRSYDVATVLAKDMIKAYGGRAPDKSYFLGCSEGGREAVMMSQRFPTHFDGILAGAPGLALPYATMRTAWMVQSFAPVALAQGNIDRNGLPFINKSFTDADLAVLTSGILAKCDALDGVVDGMSQNFQACQAAFDPAQLVCSEGQTQGCLSAVQVAALKRQMGGARNSAGQPIDVPWLWDAGMARGQMREWWIGAFNAAQTASNLTSPPLATTHITPPVPFDMTAENGSRPYQYMLSFNFDTDLAGVFATTPLFTESAWGIYNATDSDLSAFRNRGGKMMVYHGMSDGPFNVNQTIKWWNEVNDRNHGTADSFVRFFPIPGMGHCLGGGGAATNEVDLFAALVDWVEKGTAPAAVTAKAPAGTPWPGRTRPLCPYPKYAAYKGGGTIEDAANFQCALP